MSEPLPDWEDDAPRSMRCPCLPTCRVLLQKGYAVSHMVQGNIFGGSLSCNVIGGAVCRRADRKWKATEQSHSAIKAQQLFRFVDHPSISFGRRAFSIHSSTGVRRLRMPINSNSTGNSSST